MASRRPNNDEGAAEKYYTAMVKAGTLPDPSASSINFQEWRKPDAPYDRKSKINPDINNPVDLRVYKPKERYDKAMLVAAQIRKDLRTALRIDESAATAAATEAAAAAAAGRAPMVVDPNRMEIKNEEARDLACQLLNKIVFEHIKKIVNENKIYTMEETTGTDKKWTTQSAAELKRNYSGFYRLAFKPNVVEPEVTEIE